MAGLFFFEGGEGGGFTLLFASGVVVLFLGMCVNQGATVDASDRGNRGC